MCFHSKQTKKAKELKQRFKVSIAAHTESEVTLSSINGFEFPKTPIITNTKRDEIQLFHWGLVPHWAKDTSIKASTLNARVETLTEKPSFKKVVSNRCLILSDGFYEWQWKDTKGKKKDKYLITVGDNDVFTFAGLFDKWIDAKGNTYDSYTIITKEAEGVMREIHNSKLRMPVLLSHKDEGDWLDGIHINEITVPIEDFNTKNLNPQLGLF